MSKLPLLGGSMRTAIIAVSTLLLGFALGLIGSSWANQHAATSQPSAQTQVISTDLVASWCDTHCSRNADIVAYEQLSSTEVLVRSQTSYGGSTFITPFVDYTKYRFEWCPANDPTYCSHLTAENQVIYVPNASPVIFRLKAI